ncbi:MAG: LPS-assembly protein LptD [Bacteroidales bacterium]|nr:LPS-assembly protein LptD [Bacteroidales bacterium]
MKATGEVNEIQDTIKSVDTVFDEASDSTEKVLDTLKYDTVLTQKNDVAVRDTLSKGDTIAPKETKTAQKQASFINDKIERSCSDSTVQDFKNNKIYYYGEAKVVYEDITIEAAFIEFDFEKRTVFAQGLRDSTGKLYGAPVFIEGDQRYNSETMTFNFDTKKGIITKVFTEDAMGYIHGAKIKKLEDNTINIKSGSFTTCSNPEHPHFEFHFGKAKVIPDDKIVTGPAYFKLEETPLPIGVPFGIFPNSKGQRNGILVPSWGESANRGFYLENGGFYWGINENLDLQLVGDIYTRGSWALKPTLRYNKRYAFNGSFSGSYAVNKIGSKGSADYNESTDFKVRWVHKQDPKARPKSSFSADVYIVSSNYNKYNAISSNEYLSNTFQSSVAYQTSIGSLFNFTANASHSQNTLTRVMTVTLPEVTLTMNRVYPFKNVGKTGKKRWYKDMYVSYTANAKNYVSMADSLFFKPGWLDNLQNGIQHRIPISMPVKLFKYVTWTTSVNVLDRMYFRYFEKQWVSDPTMSSGGYLKTDTINQFRNVFSFDVSSSMTTKIYGQVNFKKGPIRAIRHVFTPSIGFSYNPDFSKDFWNYYNTYYDANGIEQLYSMFQGNVYGTPPSGQSGRINYSFGNNLEIKVPSRKDTITGVKKVKVIEDITFSGSYDIAKDSLNFSYLSVNGRTTLFKNLSVRYSSIWDPYILDSTGRKQLNQFEWDVNKRLFRKNSVSWNFSLSYSLNNDTFKKNKGKGASNTKRHLDSPLASEEEMNDIRMNPDSYVDWSTQWSLSLSYNLTLSNSLSYINYLLQDNRKVIQTLGINGNINLTPKWKVSVQTGWDFELNKLSYTSLTIYRDLHCWEMRFNWIPLGTYKSWNFQINVKAAALQDLKLTKKKDYRDN